MKKVIIVAAVAVISLAAGVHARQAQITKEEAIKQAQHDGYSKGCVAAAQNILTAILGASVDPAALEKGCERLRESEGQ